MVQQLIWVALGGALGTVARFGVGQWIASRNFPWATLSVNLLGSFLIGFVMGAYGSKWGTTHSGKLFLGTGFCGGFTTFSALSFENLELLQQGRYTTAITYIVTSLALGLIAVALGWWLGHSTH